MHKYFQQWVFIIVITLLTGCANLPLQTISPEVSLADFKLSKLGLLEQTYLLRLHLKNPNPFSLPINSVDYQLHINDQEFAKGVSNQAVTIPASGEEFLDIKVASNFMRLFEKWGDWKNLIGQPFKYRLEGNLGVIDGGPKLPFEYKGDISLSRGGSGS